jgi:hypothetical protein
MEIGRWSVLPLRRDRASLLRIGRCVLGPRRVGTPCAWGSYPLLGHGGYPLNWGMADDMAAGEALLAPGNLIPDQGFSARVGERRNARSFPTEASDG